MSDFSKSSVLDRELDEEKSMGRPSDPRIQCRCAAGRRAKKTNGSAPADTNGTRSSREECVPPACTSRLRRSASCAAEVTSFALVRALVKRETIMKVVIFGATGMVGQGVLRECLLDPDVESVLAVVRNSSLPQHGKLREIVHRDVSDLSAI